MRLKDRLSPQIKDRLRPYAMVARQLRSGCPNVYEAAYSCRTFSQFAEDLFLANHFADQQTGLYVDIGAYHPFAGSNTYLLHRRGWTGINVEPDPDAYELFRRHRPEDVNLRLAVSGAQGSSTFVRAGSFAGLEDETWLWPGMDGERITVQTRTLAQILRDHVPPGRAVDLLDVDCEGHDLEVLASNDWEAYRPRLVLAEAHSADQARALRDFMRTHEYREHTQIYLTLVFSAIAD